MRLAAIVAVILLLIGVGMATYTYNRGAVERKLRELGSPLHASDFEGYGVAPDYLAAVSIAESSGGTAGYATGGTHNPYGYGIHQGFRYPTWKAATSAVAKSLAGGLYKGSGLMTPAQIATKYAPSSENDTGTYTNNIISLRRQFGSANPQGNVFTGAATALQPNSQGRKLVAPAAKPSQEGFTLSDLAMQAMGGDRSRSFTSRMGEAYVAEKLSGQAKQVEGTKAAVTVSKALGGVVAPEGMGKGGAGATQAAKKWLGTPYSWGGGTTSGPSRGFAQGAPYIGFDCSSLMQYAWAQMGVNIPRTTYGQIKTGRAVSNLAHAQPGDLLFPHTGHVQMYMGNGKVVEAPQTGGHVQIVDARDSYIAIRRPG